MTLLSVRACALCLLVRPTVIMVVKGVRRTVEQVSPGAALTGLGALLALIFFLLYLMRGSITFALLALLGTALAAAGVTIILVGDDGRDSVRVADKDGVGAGATAPLAGDWIVGRWAVRGSDCEFPELITEFQSDGRLLVYPEQGSWSVDGASLVLNSPHRGSQATTIRRLGNDSFSMTYADGRNVTLQRCAPGTGANSLAIEHSSGL